tara:strand:- start:3873 stop:4799 length:927 start_codon:yes stop_codon:yes gene_type:complete
LDTKALTQKIKKVAKDFSFSHIGIAEAKTYKEDYTYLNNWIQNGYHASMHWIENRLAERSNILEYYPDAESVIIVTQNYYTGNTSSSKDIGKFSNYAWGDDYHVVIKKKLHELLAEIKGYDPELDGIVCVDTSPIMEKAWAQRAGIGWIGKHTNLITKDIGSWFFLGSIIINKKLEYDNFYEQDLCGTCTACIDDCPTGAIIDAYQLDSNKCISYLTIEHRGDLPDEYQDKLDGWIYGCDICQETCPWNKKFAEVTNVDEFEPRDGVKNKSLKDWSNMSEEEYKKIFKKSAVKRTKYSGLMRNIKANL